MREDPAPAGRASRARLCAASLAACCLLVGATANAEDAAPPADERVGKAEALFEDGRTLVGKGDYRAACSQFEASLALVEGIGTLFNLADCWEHIGRTASALSLYQRVARLAQAGGQEARARVAEARAAALEARVPTLVINLETPDPAVSVKRDGTAVARETLGTSIPVDPGVHRVSASTPLKQFWSSQVDVPDGHVLVVVTIPSFDVGPTPSATAPVPQRKATVASGGAADARASEPSRRTGTAFTAERVALVLGGIGVAGLVTGATFGLQFNASKHDAAGVCPSSRHCTAEEMSQHSGFLADARRERSWSYVGFGAGALAGTAAAIVYGVGGSAAERTVEAGAVLGPNGSFSATLRRRF